MGYMPQHILYQSCLILSGKKCRHKLFCWALMHGQTSVKHLVDRKCGFRVVLNSGTELSKKSLSPGRLVP